MKPISELSSGLSISEMSTIAQWLNRLDVDFYQCEQCSALHLSYLQKIEGVDDAKIELIDDILVISISAEIKQSAIVALLSELSQINQSIFFSKVYLDVNDTNPPKIVFSYSMHFAERVTFNQFSMTLASIEEESLQIISELYNGELLNSKQCTSEGSYLHMPQAFH
ncbi:type III secretion system chaperone family protein [Orbus mooreae]|uniref:YbjN domain-containing protein n=1 Tax=Orbus mooreae TaxID=3074107 RepID=UPI00370DC8A6